ncbi:MAG: DUF2268 domain-containing protein [Gordonibacter sp.]|uniref:DUF2268 domain-containing protein n=1 Tax=Gordonibacter sp. TaxID=1968902 RepID=UPI002FCCA5DF
MKIEAVRSDEVYRKILAAPDEKKNDIYRYGLMQPFKKKWDCYSVPMKAATPGGYDVIMASEMLGHLVPRKVDDAQAEHIGLLSNDALWRDAEQAIRMSLACFESYGIELPVQDYLFTLLLADAENVYVRMAEGYSGDGGIPGYIFAWLVPNEFTLGRLPAALAHEANHNVRFQFIAWKNDITLGEMIVSEGLAENFATSLFGEAQAGPWVAKTDRKTLDECIKPAIRHNLSVRGLDNLNSYLYGDELAALQGLPAVGMPYCAGYACGYYLVKHYLEKTGKGIVEATLLPADEILEASEDFWRE